MPKEIIIQTRPTLTDEELERRARLLLSTQTDSGDDAVLDRAIKIAHDEGLDVVFRRSPTGKIITPGTAYSLRYERGIDLRMESPAT